MPTTIAPAVPVQSQVLDANGRLTPELTNFLRQLADYAADIADVEARAMMSGAPSPTPASSGPSGLDLSLNSLAVGMPPTLASYPIDVRDGTASQVHISSTPGDDGTWILSSVVFGSPLTYISSGCMWNGSSWIAKNSQAAILIISGTQLTLGYGTSLPVGSAFTPLTVFVLDLTRTTAPAAGSKVVWADPADSYRLKLVP